VQPPQPRSVGSRQRPRRVAAAGTQGQRGKRSTHESANRQARRDGTGTSSFCQDARAPPSGRSRRESPGVPARERSGTPDTPHSTATPPRNRQQPLWEEHLAGAQSLRGDYRDGDGDCVRCSHAGVHAMRLEGPCSTLGCSGPDLNSSDVARLGSRDGVVGCGLEGSLEVRPDRGASLSCS
jgi:hypothetical protein